MYKDNSTHSQLGLYNCKQMAARKHHGKPWACPQQVPSNSRCSKEEESMETWALLQWHSNNKWTQCGKTSPASFIAVLLAHSPDIYWVLQAGQVGWWTLKTLYAEEGLCLGCHWCSWQQMAGSAPWGVFLSLSTLAGLSPMKNKTRVLTSWSGAPYKSFCLTQVLVAM